MPVKPAILSDELLKDLGVETEASENAMEVDCNGSNGVHDIPDENPYFLEMEKRLCDLVQSGNLHWRHHQMAIGKYFRIFSVGSMGKHLSQENETFSYS